jgi:hypothetical protein
MKEGKPAWRNDFWRIRMGTRSIKKAERGFQVSKQQEVLGTWHAPHVSFSGYSSVSLVNILYNKL